MIFQTSTGDFPAGAPCYDGGGAYAVRVVQFSAGATIAFDNPKSTRKILGYFAYRNSRPGGWKSIYLTGTAVIEIATSPEESFGGSGVAGVATIDLNQNTVIVGPPGSQTTDPVQVQTKWRSSYKLALIVAAPVGNTSLMALEAGANLATRLRRLRLTGIGIGATAASPTLPIYLGRTTAASSGGSLRVPQKDDGTDNAFSGIVRTAGATTPASLTDTTALVAPLYDAPAIANIPHGHFIHEYVFDGFMYKPVLIPAGVTNGVNLFSPGCGAGAVGFVVIELWLTEE